ncbi:MAG: hypothetical protein HY363_00845 [Candidatus Aenigmarchaeota archaeon]|nr:hypothetical protein [Candidatus Aenigmarchaeota archaeon]
MVGICRKPPIRWNNQCHTQVSWYMVVFDTLRIPHIAKNYCGIQTFNVANTLQQVIATNPVIASDGVFATN